MKRPKNVSIALRLLWLVIFLGIISSIVQYPAFLEIAKSSGFGHGFAIFTLLFSLGIMIFFFYMIKKGKNWARITYLVLFMLGLIMNIFSFNLVTVISKLFWIVSLVLQIIALVFLFQKDSSEWFKRK